MANYTTDPQGAPIAPDLGQAPAAVPVIDLVADGEPADAASVNPIFQILGNHVAFLHVPQAAGSDYETPLRPWRNSKGQLITHVDHFGLVRGPFEYYTDWPGNLSEYVNTLESGAIFLPFGQRLVGLSNSSDLFPGWSYGIRNQTTYTAAALVRVESPVPVSSRAHAGRTLVLSTAPSVVDDYSVASRVPGWTIATNMLAQLEFTVPKLIKQGPVAVGWRCIPVAADPGDPAALPGGIFFYADDTDPNWHFVTRTLGGATTISNTGLVATDTPHNFRLVFTGSEIDFGNANRALGFIDGTLVGNHTATLPAVGNLPHIYFGARAALSASPSARVDVTDLAERHFVYL